MSNEPERITSGLIECVVTGKKNYYGVETFKGGSANRIVAAPGDIVFVTAHQLETFPDRLTSRAAHEAIEREQKIKDNAVAEAKKFAEEELRKAKSGSNVTKPSTAGSIKKSTPNTDTDTKD